MSINYKYKTHIKNPINGKSKCGKDDIKFSDNPNCKQCLRVEEKHNLWILKENAFKRGMK